VVPWGFSLSSFVGLGFVLGFSSGASSDVLFVYFVQLFFIFIYVYIAILKNETDNEKHQY